MLTLETIEKLIFEGMTEDSGENFSDMTHHVRNAARMVHAALAAQQDALQAVRDAFRDNGFDDRASLGIGEVDALQLYLSPRVMLAVFEATKS